MKTFTLQPTRHNDLFRVVDRDGNWKHYLHQPSGTYLRGATTILTDGYPKGAGFEQWLANHSPEERDSILAAAGDKGDMVHRVIDLALNTPGNATILLDRRTEIHNRAINEYRKLTNAEWDATLSWAHFWTKHKPIVITAEGTGYNLKLGHAGTWDAILILTEECGVRTCKCAGLKDKIGLFDWKSGSGIYPTYSAQTASYANSENLHEYLPDGRSIEYTAILRIGTRHKTTGGYEMQVSVGDEIHSDYARFLAAKAIADYDYKPFDPALEIQDIPDTIELAVQHFDFEAAKAVAKPKRARKKAVTKTVKTK